jgi:large subunit ribosomal protein L24
MKKQITKTSLKLGNIVKVLTGKDKGKSGKILSLFSKSNKVLVQGINVKFRHVKPTSKDKKGEIKQIELPINCSNVKIID